MMYSCKKSLSERILSRKFQRNLHVLDINFINSGNFFLDITLYHAWLH